MTTVPLPDPRYASQFFALFLSDTFSQIYVTVPTEDQDTKKVPILEGGRMFGTAKPIVYMGEIKPGSQLTRTVTPTFESSMLEHAVQKGFTLDHVYSKLKTFDVEATLYEGRNERLEKLESLRDSKTLLNLVCDFGVFKNYIITSVEPELSYRSANAFDVSIRFQEIRTVELIAPRIVTYKDAGVERGDIPVDKGVCTLSIGTSPVPPKKGYWLEAIKHFASLPVRMLRH